MAAHHEAEEDEVEDLFESMPDVTVHAQDERKCQ
jgi:hypothetical protein